MGNLHRNPRVKNKYNLTLKDIRNLIILDRSRIKEPLFWRNNVVKAWCIMGSVGNSKYCDETSYWIGVYDEDKPTKKKVKISFDCFGGMCSYKFEKFYNPKDIENDEDLQIQEMFLEKINYLIDEGILAKSEG